VRGKVGLSQSLVSSQKFHTKDSPSLFRLTLVVAKI
jgi:hypothetical protein